MSGSGSAQDGKALASPQPRGSVATTRPGDIGSGDMVYLTDLKTRKYNYHQGTVLASERTDRSERIPVTLGVGKVVRVRPDNVRLSPLAPAAPGSTVLCGGLPVTPCFQALRDSFSQIPRASLVPDGVLSLVVSFLQLSTIDMRVVRVRGASSAAEPNIYYEFKPGGTLIAGIDDCWISKSGSCPNGVGSEWVEYNLRPSSAGGPRVCLLQKVSMRIPSDGPLSVRTFHIETEKRQKSPSQEAGAAQPSEPARLSSWTRASADFTVLRGGLGTHPMQTYVIDPPIFASKVRVVCTENQQGQSNPRHDSIGFWQINFE